MVVDVEFILELLIGKRHQILYEQVTPVFMIYIRLSFYNFHIQFDYSFFPMTLILFLVNSFILLIYFVLVKYPLPTLIHCFKILRSLWPLTDVSSTFILKLVKTNIVISNVLTNYVRVSA